MKEMYQNVKTPVFYSSIFWPMIFACIFIFPYTILADTPPYQNCNLSHSSFEVDSLGAGGGASIFDPDGSWDCQSGTFENNIAAWTTSGTLPSHRVYGSSDIFAVEFSVPQSNQYQITIRGRMNGKVWSFGKNFLSGYEWGGYEINMLLYVSNPSGYNTSLSGQQLLFEGLSLEPDCEGCAYTIAFDDEGSFWQGVGSLTWDTISLLLTGGAADLAALLDLAKITEDIIPEEWDNSEFLISGDVNLVANQNYKCKLDISSYIYSNSIAAIGGHVGIIDLDFVIDELTIEPKINEMNINAFSGSHGSVDPSGNILVPEGSDITFTAYPDSGYDVDKWYVNGQVAAGSDGQTSYSLLDIQQDTSVIVLFKPEPQPASLNVTSPTTGNYARGKIMYIAWEPTGLTGDVKIELYNNATLHSLIDSSVSATIGRYTWNMPYDIPVGDNYTIKISSMSSPVFGESDVFKIIEFVDNGSPIYIYSAQELQKVSSGQAGYERDRHYILANDITLFGTNNFQPIGNSYTNYFRGVFDGQGHKIIGLHIDLPDNEDVGLFAVLMDSGVIKNLTLEGGFVRGKGAVGALVGECGGTVINCHSSAEVRNRSDADARSGVGGLIGELHQGQLSNCSTYKLDNDSEVRGYADETGGLVGLNESGRIKWCWSTMHRIRGYGNYGEGDEVGGIVGRNHGEVIECYSAVAYEVDGEHYIGGIVGENHGVIRDCYCAAQVDGASYNIGGIAGKNDGGTIERCYATGRVDVSDGGGLVGRNYSSIRNSFWDVQTTAINTSQPTGNGQGSVENCYGLPTSDMKHRNTYTSSYSANWDFSNIWIIDEGVDYPRLRGTYKCLPAPTGVVASDERAGSILIRWDSLANAGAYRVYRSDSSDGVFNPLSDWLVGISSYEDTLAGHDITYYYKVKAAYTINGAGESEFSSADDGMCTFQLPQPTNVTATKDIMDYVLVQWEAVAGANYYKVYRAESETATRIDLSGWVDSLAFLDTTATPGVMYHYWVTASADNSGSGQSAYAGPAIGNRPTPPDPDITEDGQVDLSDYSVLSSQWRNSPCTEPDWCNGADIDHSGAVGIEDFLIIAEHWLQGTDSGQIVFVEEAFIPASPVGSGIISGIELSPDESSLFAAYWADASADPVEQYSLSDYSLINTMSYGRCHEDVGVSSNGRYVFISSYYQGNVSRFDLQNNNQRTDLSANYSWPALVATTPNRQKLVAFGGRDGRSYDMNNDGLSVYDISGDNFSLLGTVNLPDEPTGQTMTFSPNSDYVYVICRPRDSSQPMLYEVSIEGTYEITRSLAIDSAQLNSIVLVGSELYIADGTNNRLVVIDRAGTFTSTEKTYDLEFTPGTMKLHPNGRDLYILMPNDNKLVVWDTVAEYICGSYDQLNDKPDDIAFCSDGRIFVSNRSVTTSGIQVLRGNTAGIGDKVINSN